MPIAKGKRDAEFNVTLEDGREFDAYFTFDGYYQEAVVSGPPESCSPAEGELEVCTIQVESGPVLDYEQWATDNKLTAKDRERIEERLAEELATQDSYYDYDEMRE